MALATASAAMESKSHIQSETRVQHSSYQEVHMSEQRTEQRSEQRTEKVKKKKSMRRHKDEGTISVSKSSEKLSKKLKASADGESNPKCEKCERPVYAMERIKAERRVWHKECFRCVQCNKALTVETYQSDHTTLYCKPHFKQLFEPKPVEGEDQTDEARPKKHQMIICESNPVELPPDVVRASDKPDLGIEELTQLDLKSRFEVFERGPQTEQQQQPQARAPREKSQALLSKLAKFKAKGMDVGVSDEYLNGVPIEQSSSEPEDDEDEDAILRKSYLQTANKEQPIPFINTREIRGRFESGERDVTQRRQNTKQEIQNIRTRLFMGKQAKIKEMYEQSVLQSEQGITSADKIARELDLDLDAEKARAIKQRFENGQIFNDENQPPKQREIDDRDLFNEGIGKKSRSIFLELDANAKSAAPLSPPAHQEPPRRKEIPFIPKDVVRSEDKVEEVQIETRDISDRFKFFETYRPETTRKEFRMTPPRQIQRPKSPSPEVYHDPGVVRCDTTPDIPPPAHTATNMINVFRQMEEQSQQPHQQGPKPLKRFTPPPAGESNHCFDSSEEYSSEEDSEQDSEHERARQHYDRDDALIQAQQLARATSFRSRFERGFSDSEPVRSPSNVIIDRHYDDEDGESQLETAKSLREKFENMKVQKNTVTKSFVPKVNRFV